MLELVDKDDGIEQKDLILLFLYSVQDYLKIISQAANTTKTCTINIGHSADLLSFPVSDRVHYLGLTLEQPWADIGPLAAVNFNMKNVLAGLIFDDHKGSRTASTSLFDNAKQHFVYSRY